MTVKIKLMQTSSPYSFVDSEEKEGVVIVKGFAVHEGTFNDITIRKEELERSAASLIGKPILKNHTNNTDVIIGKVVDCECKVDPDCGDFGIFYTAEIDKEEESLLRKMQLGFICSTSVGFSAQHFCSICNDHIMKCDHWFWDEGFQLLAKDIDFLELSVVAVPADPNASIKVNFISDSDRVNFEKLYQFKTERRQNMSNNFESKYNEVVEAFNKYKMEQVDEMNKLKEEFKTTKEQLEADKADKVEENLTLKTEMEELQREAESLKEKVTKYEESFKQIEEQKLSALREKVTKLNAEVNGGYSEEEINALEESTLNRIAQSFEHISQHMVKLHKPGGEQSTDQYKYGETEENVSLSAGLTNRLKEIRGF